MFEVATSSIILPIIWGLFVYSFFRCQVSEWVCFLVVAIPGSVVTIKKLKHNIKEARTARLGFLGECAVAEQLAPLVTEGWRIYHDIPMGEHKTIFNIDHVAVGPGGVVAIETKVFSKPRKHAGNGDALRIEGEMVRLPDGRSKNPLTQAKRQAVALRDVLRDAGIRIDFVHPLVVLPGWTVSYPKGASENIRDPRNVVAWLKSLPFRDVSPKDRDAITLVLEKRCRNLRFDEDTRKVANN